MLVCRFVSWFRLLWSAKKLGFPIISFATRKIQTTQGGFNLGGTNATGQVPDILGGYGLIDKDTPQEAYTRKSYLNNNDEEYALVFSDEFNVEGRSFFPGDDPYWEAVDLHYWGTVSGFINSKRAENLPYFYLSRTTWNGMTTINVCLSGYRTSLFTQSLCSHNR